MLVECKHCGAPLDVGTRDLFVTCRYCDHTNKVRSLRTLAMETPPRFQPPPAWRPPEDAPIRSDQELRYHRGVKHRVTESSNRRGSWAGCFTFLFILLPIGINLAVNPAFREALRGLDAIPLLGGLGLGLDASAEPQLGAAPLTPPAGRSSHSGTATSDVRASTLGPGCLGLLPQAPHLSIQTHAPVQLVASTRSREDLVMLVRAADGAVHCDDDGAGRRQPLVAAALPQGVHQLWVGTLHANTVASFEMDLEWQHLDAMPGPDGLVTTGGATFGAWDVPTVPEGSWMGETRGMVQASRAKDGCRGWLPAMPHLLVRVGSPSLVQLRTESRQDLVLAMRAPDGTVHCDDDSARRRQPMIATWLAPGDYPVWVGTSDRGEEAELTLLATAEELSALPGSDGLASDAPPSIETLAVRPNGPRRRIRGSARGLLDAAAVGPTCRGFVQPAAHVVLELPEQIHLRVTARGRQDLTMIARHSDGQTRCDDDSGRGNAPLIGGTFPPGHLRVWIGTYRAEQESAFQLVVDSSPAR